MTPCVWLHWGAPVVEVLKRAGIGLAGVWANVGHDSLT